MEFSSGLTSDALEEGTPPEEAESPSDVEDAEGPTGQSNQHKHEQWHSLRCPMYHITVIVTITVHLTIGCDKK